MTDETARAILEWDFSSGIPCFIGTPSNQVPAEHLQPMARLWLMRDEIVSAMRDNWDVDHSDPGGEHILEPLLAKIEALAS